MHAYKRALLEWTAYIPSGMHNTGNISTSTIKQTPYRTLNLFQALTIQYIIADLLLQR